MIIIAQRLPIFICHKILKVKLSCLCVNNKTLTFSYSFKKYAFPIWNHCLLGKYLTSFIRDILTTKHLGIQSFDPSIQLHSDQIPTFLPPIAECSSFWVGGEPVADCMQLNGQSFANKSLWVALALDGLASFR